MLLRPDASRELRTGTQAWVDAAGGPAAAQAAAAVYTRSVPALHAAIADRYGAPVVRVYEALLRLRGGADHNAWDLIYRDDCHTTPAGGAFLASLICEALEGLMAAAAGEPGPADGPRYVAPVPPPLDPRFWVGGSLVPIAAEQLRLRDGAGGLVPAARAPLSLRRDRRRRDADPLTGEAADWHLLRPGDELTLGPIEGIAIGLITFVGPDSGLVRCEVRGEDGSLVASTATPLFDRWCYYYRLSVALLVEGLPWGRYTARIFLDAEPPDRSIATRPAPPRGPRRSPAVAAGGAHLGAGASPADARRLLVFRAALRE